MISVAILNLSSHPGLTRELVGRMTRALAHQCAEDVQPLWQIIPPAISFEASAKAPPGAAPLVIFDNPDQSGALGWHTVSPEGVPYGRVFLGSILGNGGTLHSSANSVSVTLSHELLEMVGNPHVSEWCDDHDSGHSFAEELCDPCQDQSYEVDGIHVSNFVTPLWFETYGIEGRRFDHLCSLVKPFSLTPGGYAIRRRDGVVENVWGREVPAWLRQLKTMPGSRASRYGAVG